MADEEKQEEIEETPEETPEEIEEVPEEKKVDRAEKRYQELSQKVATTSKERDKLQKERDAAKKEVEFYSSFSDTTDKYPAAKEFKDQIKEKVLQGYSMEDAAVSILAKEGKFTPAQPEPENPAGGSAVNPPASGEVKEIQDMSLEEKRAAVEEAVKRGHISI